MHVTTSLKYNPHIRFEVLIVSSYERVATDMVIIDPVSGKLIYFHPHIRIKKTLGPFYSGALLNKGNYKVEAITLVKSINIIRPH